MLRLIVLRFAILVSVASLLCLAWGVAAPVPPPKKAPPPAHNPVGHWILYWQGGTGPAVFHGKAGDAKGGYECVWFGANWLGHWSLADGMLTVTEMIDGAPAPGRGVPPHRPLTWKVTLEKGKWKGKLVNGGEFRLDEPAETAPPPKEKPDI